MTKIKGITIEIEGKATGLEKSLKSVNHQAAATSKELGQINKALKFNPGNAELVAQKQKLLGDQVKTTSEKLKALKEAEKQVKAQFEAGTLGEDKFRAFQREVIETESKLKTYKGQLEDVSKEQEQLGKNTERLKTFFKTTKTNVEDYAEVLGTKLTRAIKDGTATSDQLETALEKIGKEALGSKTDIAKLKTTLDKIDDGFSTDKISEELNGIKQSSNDANTSLGNMTGAINAGNMMKAAEILSIAGQKLKEFAGDAQEAFRTVDEGLDIITSKTGKNADNFKTEFENLYSNIAVDNTGIIGSALGEINTQLDFTGKKLEKASEVAIKYAEINRTDVSNAVIKAKQAIEAYNLSNEDFESILDSVTSTSQRTGESVDKLFDAAVKGAPIIKDLGLNFSEGVEVLGQFQKLGVDGDAALSSLTKATAIYAKDNKTLKEGLSETIEKIKNSKDEQEAYTEAVRIFGSKGAARMVDAIKRGVLSFKNLSRAAKDSSGTVVDTFDEMLDPIDQQQVAMQTLNLAMSEFGAAIAEALLPILVSLIPIIKNVAEWFRNLPEPIKQGAVVFGMILAAISALLPIIAALAAAASAADVGVGVFIASMLPVVGIVAGIGAAIAGLIAIIFNWDSVVKFMADAWILFKENVSGVWNFLLKAGADLVNGIKDKFTGMSTAIKSIWNDIVLSTKQKWEDLKNSIKDKIEAAKNIVKGAIDAIKGFFEFEIYWPKIPMPRFTISPEGWKIGDLLKGSIPTLGVDFYAKGGILTKPTAFGMNGNNLMVGGEAGPEAVLPLNRKNLGAIGDGIASTLSSVDYSYKFDAMISLLESLLRKDTNSYLDGKEVSKHLYEPLTNYSETQKVLNNRLKGAW